LTDDELNKDFDMRGLAKLERQTNKKLKGKRKRQFETLAANVSGQDFCIDASDTRFAALLDGTNDLYAVDRTHPAFRDTGAMKALLQERSKRRGKHRDSYTMEPGARTGDVGGTGGERRNDNPSSNSHKSAVCDGAFELSSLVNRIQQKVSK
jgi:hypothetical protein